MVKFALFSVDGTKVGERMGFMEYLAPGQRGLYTTMVIPSVEPVSFAYVQIERFQGAVQGVRFDISPDAELAGRKVYSPSIVRGEEILQAEEQRQAAKDRKKAEKLKKKAQQEAAKHPKPLPAIPN